MNTICWIDSKFYLNNPLDGQIIRSHTSFNFKLVQITDMPNSPNKSPSKKTSSISVDSMQIKKTCQNLANELKKTNSKSPKH